MRGYRFWSSCRGRRPVWRRHGEHAKSHLAIPVACSLAILLTWNGRPTAAHTPPPLPEYAPAEFLREDSSLNAVAFADSRRGIAVGDRGAILTTDDGGRTWTPRHPTIDCRLHDVAWIGGDQVIAVGGGYDRVTQLSRGVVLFSRDCGQSWQPLSRHDLPRLTHIQRRDDGVLIAAGDWSDAMVSNCFESRNGGRDWQMNGDRPGSVQPLNGVRGAAELARWSRALDGPAAIRDACRIDQQRLCAVGDHGVIWTSSDRGQTWNAVRGRKRHTAVLVVATRAETVAWSLVGSEALERGNRVSVLITQGTSAEQGWAAQAAVMLGAAGADLVAADAGELVTSAAPWIEIHRPAVLVLHQGLSREVQSAFIRAATQAGVWRVATYDWDLSAAGSEQDSLLPLRGVLTSDLVNDANLIVAPDLHRPAVPTLHYHYDTMPSNRRSDSVASGLTLDSGQRLAAELPVASRRQLQIIQARLSQSARIEKLMQQSHGPQQFTGSLTSLLDQTAAEDRFRLAWSLLKSIRRSSNQARALELQDLVLAEIARRFPDESASRWASTQREANRYSAEQQRLRRLLPSQSELTVAQSETVAVSPFQVPTGGVRQASAVTPLLVPQPESIDLTGQNRAATSEVDLAWESHPLVVLLRDAARRRSDGGPLQLVQEASNELKRLAHTGDLRWRHLIEPHGRRRLIATPVAVRPKLDGVLDETCWQTAAGTIDAARLRMAFDEEYVYLALEVPGAWLGDPVEAVAAGDRWRDTDLSRIDRIQLRIDTDRDIIRSMQWEIHDSLGTHDSIAGYPQWNPTWYCATARTAERVSIELAILRRDLVELPLLAGDRWHVSIRPLAAGPTPSGLGMPNPAEWIPVQFK